MKLDFLSIGGAAGAGGVPPRRAIDRRMRLLEVEPLDNARRTVRIGVIVGAAFVALLLLFAFVAPISSAAIAPGEVTVSGDKFAIQPSGSGIVSQVLVREGQTVRPGQPLVRLNGVRSGATLAQAQAQRDALRALEARLTAEGDGAATLVFPPDLTSRAGEPTAAKAMAAQSAIFARHRAILEADRRTTDESLAAARARQVAAARQMALISEELADYRMLYNRGFARLTTVRGLERTQAQLTADVAAGTASANQAAIAAKRVRDAQAMEAAAQLGQVQEQLAQVEPRLAISRYMADQDQLRSPVAGRVSGVQPMGPGMILSGGKTLMEIIPVGRPMIVEARVKPGDIDDVRVGQPATVRFETVNPRGRTAFPGKVVTLSPASVRAGAETYYKAQVILDDPALARREGLALQPGVPASVTIKTADRSLFDYLIGPFTAAVSRGMREE